MVVALGDGAAVFGCALGVDLTRRDLQDQAKAQRRPWDAAKRLTPRRPAGRSRAACRGNETRLELSVNGALRQSCVLADMIYGVPEILDHLSREVELRPGDVIFTGTPEGVGPLAPGDAVACRAFDVDGGEALPACELSSGSRGCDCPLARGVRALVARATAQERRVGSRGGARRRAGGGHAQDHGWSGRNGAGPSRARTRSTRPSDAGATPQHASVLAGLSSIRGPRAESRATPDANDDCGPRSVSLHCRRRDGYRVDSSEATLTQVLLTARLRATHSMHLHGQRGPDLFSNFVHNRSGLPTRNVALGKNGSNYAGP